MTTKKIVKATKVCPECGSDHIHVVKKECDCGYVFYKKRARRMKGKQVDWKELKKGDKIYIICDDYWESSTGEIIPMGNTGKYVIFKVVSDGLVLYNKNGFVFQSMIAEGVSPNGIVRSIPKIKRIKEQERV